MNWETVYILCKKYTDTVASGDVDIYLEHATIENGHLKLEMSDGTVFDVGNVGVIDDNVSSADYAYSSAKIDELIANVNAALAENNESIQQEITDRTNAINELQESKANITSLNNYYTKTENYSKTEVDNKLNNEVSAINSSISSINTNIDTVEGNISTIQSTLGTVQTNITTLQTDKADRPDITSVSAATPSVTLTDNTEARCGAATSLTLTLPTDTTGDYISSVVFTSGATATSLTYPDTIAMIGTDCIDGVLAPVANTRYTVIVAYDGAGLVGYVAGHEVTA